MFVMSHDTNQCEAFCWRCHRKGAQKVQDTSANPDDLLTELKELKQRVATLESGNAVPAAQRPSVRPASAVSVARPPSEILRDARLPCDADLHNLLAIVRDCYPSLRPAESSRAIEYDSQDFRAFKMVTRWLLDIGRCDLNLAHTANHWADHAAGFARFHGIKNVLISGDLLTCAAIASADVQFLNPDRYSANLMHLGLKEGYGGRPANVQAWKSVLSMGRAPAASKYRPREYERGAVTIRCAK